MKCYNCGAELTEGTKFCSYCGVKIEASELGKDEPILNKQESDEKDTVEPKTEEVEEKIFEEEEFDEDVQEKYDEPVTPFQNNHNDKHTLNAKTTLGDKAKTKVKDFWSGLSIFGKLSTISIAVATVLCLIAFLSGRVFAGIIAIVWLAVAIVAILMKKNVGQS